MQKPKPSAAPTRAPSRQTVEVEALARFRHDGEEIRPGLKMQVGEVDAEELAALGFARRVER